MDISRMPVITDSNYLSYMPTTEHSGGFEGFWESEQDMRSMPDFGNMVDDLGISLIPESEWDDRIETIEEANADMKSWALGSDVVVEDQNGTNYCWINATAFCCKLIRLRETGSVHNYSPASVGAPIKNFANRGGWGWEGLKYIIDNGINYASDWPVNAIRRSYYTDENQEKKKKHRVKDYYRVDSWNEVVSCILQGIPMSEGYNWWRHQVTGVHILKGSHDKVIANSWGTNWGESGYGVLSGSRKRANGSVALTSMLPI